MRVGEIGYTKFGTPMKIIREVDRIYVEVEFQDFHKIHKTTTYRNFKIGQIKNPYDRSVCKVGYTGDGKYKTQ